MTTPGGSVHQTDVFNALQAHERRLADLENNDGSFPWIYVGTYPTDPLTTPDSPPFENGWTSVGGVNAPVSFKRWLNWVILRGAFFGGADNTTVFTLPTSYRPLYREALAAGQLADGSGIYTVVVNTDGTVVYGTSGAI